MKKVRMIFRVLSFLLLPSVLFGSSDYIKYYAGTVKWIPLNTPSNSEQAFYMLLKKQVLSSKSLISEIATMNVKGKVQDVEMRMYITGDKLKVVNTDGTIQGSGIVQGKPWHWNYIKLTAFDSKNSVQIEDVNYITPDRLLARKTLLISQVPFMLFEVDAFEISEEKYLEEYNKIHQSLLNRI